MILILNTCPDKESAEKLAKTMVEKKIAACVSILPIEKSFYRWKGKMEEEKEFLLIIKTRDKLYSRVEAHIKANHPHEVPEIIAMPVKKSERLYSTWIERNTLIM
jgi:periplasmic divalent cation tolerance protein